MSENETRSPLKAARLHAGLSQGDIAKKLSLTTASVSRIESGARDTPYSNVEQWFAACGCALIPTYVGGADVADATRDAFAKVPMEALYQFIGVMRAWSDMSERDRRVIGAFLRTYAEEYGTTLAPPDAVTEKPKRRRPLPDSVQE